MSEKRIKVMFGAEIVVTDVCGAPLALILDEKGGAFARLPITAEEARKIARALDAFAEIHG